MGQLENGGVKNGGLENGGLENGGLENGGLKNGGLENGGLMNGVSQKATYKNDIDYDEHCDPDNPRKLEFEGIYAASRRIVGKIVRTPCSRSQLSEMLGMELYLKEEFRQKTGSFKERGLRNALMLLSDEQKKIGVTASSTGNHGCAVSYHAAQLGIPSIVVMPSFAALTKVKKCEKLGAKLVIHGQNVAAAKHHALALAKENKMIYINGFDHPHVLEGQGTVGIEILEQVPDVDAVLLSCGGGSLLTGVAVAVKHLKPDTKIYGIETDKTCSMTESLKQGERIFLPTDASLADGLRVNTVGVNTFHTLRGGGLVDEMVVVKEDWVARAIMHLVEQEKFVVEGSGALGVAALLAGLLPDLKGKKVVCVCSGGNIDTPNLTRVLERGMAAEGRLLRFKLIVQDLPSGMADLCRLLTSIGVILRECEPEKAWVKEDVFRCELNVIVETTGWSHIQQLIQTTKEHFKEYSFPEVYDH